MADHTSAQERTEAATPKRREKARAEGNVARSIEIGSVLVLGAGIIALAGFGGRMTETAADFVRRYFMGLGNVVVTESSILALARNTITTMAGLLIPLAALVMIAGVSAQLAQTGILFTAKPLAPKLNRISPATGAKRIFSKRGLVEFAKSLAKLAIVGAIIGWALYRASESLVPLMSVQLFSGYRTILGAMLEMAATGAFALAILAILDFFFQRWDHEQQLKMTRQEVKEEQKQSEGDPLVKSKVRTRQYEMSRRRMMEDVKTADVVVTNPVRYAVALKYEPSKMAAPKVAAKGARLLAKRIRNVAREAGVPIVEDPPLARALFQACKVGSSVPLSLYKAVAELLAFVYRDREPVRGGAR